MQHKHAFSQIDKHNAVQVMDSGHSKQPASKTIRWRLGLSVIYTECLLLPPCTSNTAAVNHGNMVLLSIMHWK